MKYPVRLNQLKKFVAKRADEIEDMRHRIYMTRRGGNNELAGDWREISFLMQRAHAFLTSTEILILKMEKAQNETSNDPGKGADRKEK